jgi:hypothetical protein
MKAQMKKEKKLKNMVSYAERSQVRGSRQKAP